MNQVSINQEINEVKIDSPEVLRIRKEKKFLEDKLSNLEENMDKQISNAVNKQIAKNLKEHNILELLHKNNIL